MSATLSTKLSMNLEALLALTTGPNAVTGSIAQGFLASWASGVGAAQADKIYAETRTIVASGNVHLDLAGVLTDIFGAVITFARIKAIIVLADAGNTNDVIVGGAAANPFIGPFIDAAATALAQPAIKVRPGGMLINIAPDATGWAVTPATGDQLDLTNSAGSTSVAVTTILIGASA
jgi:hypothetical protein